MKKSISKMKVLILTTRGDDIGGSHVHVALLAKGLQERGHEVIVSSGPGEVFPNFLSETNIRHITIRDLTHPINVRRDLRAIQAVKSLIATHKPDIVSCHSSKAGVVGRIASRMAGVPSVFTAHGWSFTEGHRLRRRVLAFLMEQVAAVASPYAISVSNYDHNLASSWCLLGKNKRCIIHNGLPTRKEVSPSDKDGSICRFIMVGRMAFPKRFDLVIRAFARVVQSTDATLKLVGDGPLLERETKLARELGIQERISFLGHRNDVPDLLEASDVFILASDFEGFPISTLEAMRSGLPVIVSHVGGASEAVIQGKSGFLLQEKTVEELARFMIALAGDPDLRLSMGTMGKQLFTDKFTDSFMLDQTLMVYEACRKNMILSNLFK